MDWDDGATEHRELSAEKIVARKAPADEFLATTHPRTVADSTDGGQTFGVPYQIHSMPEVTGGCQASALAVGKYVLFAAPLGGSLSTPYPGRVSNSTPTGYLPWPVVPPQLCADWLHSTRWYKNYV